MPHLKNPPGIDLNQVLADDSYAMRVIRYRAKWLVRHKAADQSEQSDLEQELALRLLKRLQSFDSTRAKLNTFIANAVRYDAYDLRRLRHSEKSLQDQQVRSLDVVIGAPGSMKTLADVCTASQLSCHSTGTTRDECDRQELLADLHSVIAKLPAHLQKACQKLLAARSLPAARRTVTAKVRNQLRRHFEAAGLRDYV